MNTGKNGVLSKSFLCGCDYVDKSGFMEVLTMTVNKARKIRDALIVAGFAIVLLANVYEPLFLVGTAVVASCLIPHFLYNKCPHCGKQLGRNEGKYCQHCGKQIDD